MGCAGWRVSPKKLPIAFCCWAKGFFTKDAMDGFRQEPTTKLLSEMEGFEHIYNQKSGKFGIRIQRNLIPDYATKDFWEALGLWRDWKMFGFPHSGGTDEQGALYMDILRVIQSYAEKMGVS